MTDVQQWTFMDRTDWSSGEWDNEPDKVQWTDEDTGLVCLLHRSHFGAWCGYVGLPPSHPLHGRDYEGIDADIHGGLTFADGCDPQHDPVTGRGICHVPEPGEPDSLWWIGFDCAHSGDLSPGALKFREIIPGIAVLLGHGHETYRNLDYARIQTRSLARQLAHKS